MLRGWPHFIFLLFAIVLVAGHARVAQAEPEEMLMMPGKGEVDMTDSDNKSPEAQQESNETLPVKERVMPAKPGRKARKVAAVERERQPMTIERDEVETAAPTHDPAVKQSHMAFGLVGGVTTMSSGGGLNFGGDSAKFNFLVAVPADFRAKYWGVDLEGYYSSAAYTVGNSDSSYQSFGGMGDVKAMYPFTTGHVTWTPKVGVGYAYLAQSTDQSGAASGIDAGASLNTNGAYALIGLDVEMYSRFILWVDYAFSFYGNATLTFSGAASALTNAQPYTSYSATFQRLRAGAYYRVLPKFLVGFQFIQRTVNADDTTGFATTLPVLFTPQNQYGLSLLFQF